MRNKRPISPPRLADRFFKWYCRNELRESILGDLHERFAADMKRGKFYASAQYWISIFRFINKHTIRRENKGRYSSQTGSYRSFFRSSFRHLIKHQRFSMINISGLAIGVASFTIIEAYVFHERSFDNFHPNISRLYRTSADNIDQEGVLLSSEAMGWVPQGKALKDEFPEIDRYTTIRKHFETTSIRYKDQVFGEDLVLAVDENFLDLFHHSIISGSGDRMAEPNTVILTQSVAKKYFKGEDAIGRLIEVQSYWENEGPFEVVAVIEDTPANTHLKFEVLVSLASMKRRTERDSWNCLCYYTYLLLDEQADVNLLAEKISQISTKYLGEESDLRFGLTPVKDIHLNSYYTFEPEPVGDSQAVDFMEIIAFVILITAWINYINLSTAKASERHREVSIRKVIGAGKKQLFFQFFAESVILNTVAVFIALVIIQLSLSHLNQWFDNSFSLLHIYHPFLWISLSMVLMIGAVLSGVYPSVMLSSYSPGPVLSTGKTTRRHDLRKGLILFQYMASFSLIVFTLTVYLQLHYMRNTETGIHSEKVLVVENPVFQQSVSSNYSHRFRLFHERLNQKAFVQNTGYSYGVPGTDQTAVGSTYGAKLSGMPEPKPMPVYIIRMDEGFVPALNVDLISGRNFNKKLASDSSAVMLNETFVRHLEVVDPATLINEKIQLGVRPDAREWLIVGIVKDFNRMALRNAVEPTVYIHNPIENPVGFGHQIIKLNSTSYSVALEEIEQLWDEIFPETSFEATFLDEKINNAYANDRSYLIFFSFFATVAVLIASLGLTGLSSFISYQRAKEIGIRKALGASVNSLLKLLSADFTKLFLLGSLLCFPITYWVMSGWLSGYAYRIDIPWWTFLVGCFSLVIITVLSIGSQTLGLARTNPANVLRNE